MVQPRNIVVVGGGITGLSAAYTLQKLAEQQDTPTSIALFERDRHLGGKIQTERRDGFVIEGGPDTFVATKPWAVELCRDLGIADRLHGTNPERNRTFILHHDRLHRLPGGLTMMIPTEIKPMLATGLLSWPGKVRMGMDFLIPPRRNGVDETMGQFVSRRIGREAYERLIEPLMSGIYAGDGDKLSLNATLPYLKDLERDHGGLVRGALAIRRTRRVKRQSGSGWRSLFLTPRTGLAEIVEALTDALESAGAGLHLGVALANLSITDDRFRLKLSNGSEITADGLILATPAYVTAGLLRLLDPALAEELGAIEYVSTATVSMAFREDQLGRPLDGYGYVIPRREQRKALACTWTSTKFPHRAPDGYALLRVFIGRAGQQADISWTESELQELARQELSMTLGIEAQPLFSRVQIFQDAMPQYNLGHPERMDRIQRHLERWPRISLAGAGYTGIGIPDCIHSGEQAASQLFDRLAATWKS
jgi:oxygen-dependent protoporphyrinogen oxidase